MRKGKRLMYAVACLAFTANAFGGYFEVEVPAYLEAADVLNPTDSVKAELDALLREEITNHPAEVNNAAVVFTKNGEFIYPEVERTETDGWSEDRLIFHPAGEFSNQPGSWDAAHWHLREVGQPNYNGVYDLAEDIFGYPFWTADITVEWDPSLPQTIDGYYHITNQTIYLQSWRRWWDYLNQNPVDNWQFHDDAAVLTRCMLQAWHHIWQCTWDHFGSMRLAAWIAIHNKLGDDGYELGFNDLFHDDQRDDRPYYKCLDNYNTEALATRLPRWTTSDVDDRIDYWRYGAANYCWWKVYKKQPLFMFAFNREFYAWVEEHFLPPLDCKEYKIFADTADDGTPIEGQQFPEWYKRQPILRPDHWCDDRCALALDRTTARVLAYRRYIDGAGDEKEVGHGGVGVVVEKDDWEGGNLRYTSVNTNAGGYGEWNFPIEPGHPDEGIKLTARLDLGPGPITDSRWGIDSDAAYEDDALYGVVTDAAVGGGGTVTIKKGGVERATVPVVGKAFRWTPDSTPAPGEYELVYNPPGGAGGRSYLPARVLKDGARRRIISRAPAVVRRGDVLNPTAAVGFEATLKNNLTSQSGSFNI